MTEENGGKTLPDPGKSSINNVEACGTPVHRLDTLPSFDAKKKMAEKLFRILATAAPSHLEARGAPVHQQGSFST